MKIYAMAKVNLGLDVLRRREDGYHEVRMIMQTLKLHDELIINKRSDDKIGIDCNNENLECDENNLIYRAAVLIMETAGIHTGLDIRLTKNIPIAAGMAGGSTDAAATLVGLNHILELNYSNEKLKELGVRLGADVPYCIEGGTQLSEGIGEKLTKLCPAPRCIVLVAKPHISVSTKYVYENLHVDNIKKHPDIDSMLKAIEEGKLHDMAKCMENILENVTESKYPVITDIKKTMLEYGALNALMSGSGPTVFGLFEEEHKARAALEALKKSNETSDLIITEMSDDTAVVVHEDMGER